MLGQIFDFAKENPLIAGAITFGVIFFLSNMFGGNNRGLFNQAGTAVKAGGAGLAVSIASALLGGKGLGDLIPDFGFGDDEPDAAEGGPLMMVEPEIE